MPQKPQSHHWTHIFKTKVGVYILLVLLSLPLYIFQGFAQSSFEDVDVQIEVIDTQNPDPISNLDLTPGYGFIEAEWVISPTYDVATQNLYISNDNGLTWTLVDQLDPAISATTITGLPFTYQTYYVKIETEDINGNLSTEVIEITTTLGSGGGEGEGEGGGEDNLRPYSNVEPVAPLISTPNVSLTYNATDDDGSVAFVRIYVSFDYGAYEQVPGDFTSSPVSLIGLQDGVYRVFSLATDDLGKTEYPPATPDTTFTVDASGPDDLDFTANPQFTRFPSTTLTFTTPSPGDIKDIYISGDVEGGNTETWIPFPGVGIGVSINLEDTEGPRQIKVKARDQTDNEGDWITKSVIIDRTAPEIPEHEFPEVITTLNFDFTIIDWPPDLSHIMISGDELLNNQNTFVDLDLGSAVPSTLELFITGDYGIKTFRLTATDKAGNTAYIDLEIEYINEFDLYCGNDELNEEVGEECDDGNREDGDGCDSMCLIEEGAGCGDGIVQEGLGEECDDGNTEIGDGCDDECFIEEGAGCGDGIVQEGLGEECDDGNTLIGDGCDDECLIEEGAECGDGILQESLGEECDDGNTDNDDGCDEECFIEEDLDRDNDGIPDDEEETYGTDPDDPDTDNDGLSDGEEVYDYNTNPLLPDTDNDNLNDGDEVNEHETDPLLPDTDNDCFSDFVEITFNSDPLDINDFPPDENGDCIPDEQQEEWEEKQEEKEEDSYESIGRSDSDNDGLSDLLEFEHGTDPFIADTDGDGLTDGEEVLEFGTDPLDPESNIENLKTRITNFKDGDLIGNTNPLIRGTSKAEEQVNIYAYDKNREKILLCETVTDEQGKFVCISVKDLQSGIYDIQAEAISTDGKVRDKSTRIKIVIDLSLGIPPPFVEAISEIPVPQPIVKDISIIINENKPTVFGNTIYNSEVIAIFKSLITTASLIADSPEGDFSITAPRNLDFGEHEVILYAITPEGLRSDDVIVPFEIVPMEDRLIPFDIIYLIIVALMIAMIVAEQKKYERTLLLKKQKQNKHKNNNNVKKK